MRLHIGGFLRSGGTHAAVVVPPLRNALKKLRFFRPAKPLGLAGFFAPKRLNSRARKKIAGTNSPGQISGANCGLRKRAKHAAEHALKIGRVRTQKKLFERKKRVHPIANLPNVSVKNTADKIPHTAGRAKKNLTSFPVTQTVKEISATHPIPRPPYRARKQTPSALWAGNAAARDAK